MNAGPKRMVHQNIWASGQVAKLSRDARLLFIGLITLGDDDGRLKAPAPLIRSQIFPYDDDVKVADVARWLKEIEGQNLVVKYEIEGEEYYFHPKWDDYQHIREDRRRDSHIPAPTLDFPAMTTKRQPTGNRVGVKSPLNISKVNIIKDNTNTVAQEEAFQVFWGKYPNKKAKKAAWKAWAKLVYTPELGAKILAALDVAITTDGWTKDKGRYVPHPASWINGERWEDDLTPVKKNTKYDSVSTKTVRG